MMVMMIGGGGGGDDADEGYDDVGSNISNFIHLHCFAKLILPSLHPSLLPQHTALCRTNIYLVDSRVQAVAKQKKLWVP